MLFIFCNVLLRKSNSECSFETQYTLKMPIYFFVFLYYYKPAEKHKNKFRDKSSSKFKNLCNLATTVILYHSIPRKHQFKKSLQKKYTHILLVKTFWCSFGLTKMNLLWKLTLSYLSWVSFHHECSFKMIKIKTLPMSFLYNWICLNRFIYKEVRIHA